MIQNEPISGLLLDETNPRFADAVSSQVDAISALLRDAPTKMLNLAKDIVAEASLNPTETAVAVEEDGELVVIEGNRRLACLKLLANPDLAADAGAHLEIDLVKRFKALAGSGSYPSTMDVFLAEDRDAAKHWIDLRHTGENDGVGVLEWAAWQTNNYRRKRGSQADRATIFCEAIELTFPEDATLLEAVAAVRRTRLTTLGRLIADPDVRSNLGFDFQSDSIVYHYSPEDLRTGIARIFSDLAGDLSVTDIKTKAQRRAYVADRHDALPDRSRRLPEPQVPSAPDIGPDEAPAEATPGDGPAADPEVPSTTGDSVGTPKAAAKAQKPEPVIFHKLKLPNVNPRINKLLQGAQKINIDDSPQVAGILIRILLELVVSEGIEKGVVPSTEGAVLTKKIRKALLAIDPECYNPMKRQKELELAWTRTQDNDGMAVQSLHAFVHNLFGDPTASEVRSLSSTFRPVLVGIDALLSNNT